MTEEEANAIRARITEPEIEKNPDIWNPLSPEQRADRCADMEAGS